MKYHKPPFVLREMKLEVTHRCSLQCVHCSSDASPASRLEMSAGDCSRILSEAVEMGVGAVALSGGEPLLWAPLGDVVRLAASKGVRVTVYTSGNIPEPRERFSLLREKGAETCVFSLFGASATVHERITRGSGSFNRTLTAIDMAGAAGLRTELHFVPFSHTYRELDGLATLARRQRVERVSVLRFVPQGRGHLFRRHVMSKAQNLELRRTIMSLRVKGHDIRTGSPYNFLMVNPEVCCPSGIDRLIVGPDLRIYPCDAFKQVKAEELVATLDHSTLNGRSVRECWDRSPFLNAVRKYLTTPFADECASCPDLERCASGCLAQKVLASGDLRKQPDPDCIRQ